MVPVSFPLVSWSVVQLFVCVQPRQDVHERVKRKYPGPAVKMAFGYQVKKIIMGSLVQSDFKQAFYQLFIIVQLLHFSPARARLRQGREKIYLTIFCFFTTLQEQSSNIVSSTFKPASGPNPWLFCFAGIF